MEIIKIRKVGNSKGICLNHKILDNHNWEEGDLLKPNKIINGFFLTKTNDEKTGIKIRKVGNSKGICLSNQIIKEYNLEEIESIYIEDKENSIFIYKEKPEENLWDNIIETNLKEGSIIISDKNKQNQGYLIIKKINQNLICLSIENKTIKNSYKIRLKEIKKDLFVDLSDVSTIKENDIKQNISKIEESDLKEIKKQLIKKLN